MLIRRVFPQLFRFCTNNPNIQSTQSTQSNILSESERKQQLQIPVHLKPYDKAKYQVPMKKIKKNSGYAMVQIEPFPRARIMKICYNILHDIKKGIPEDYIFRILTEEKMKYIMSVVDKEEDVQQLEKLFGRIPIEIFIRNLADQLQVISVVRKLQPWDMSEQQKKQIEDNFIQYGGIHPGEKNPAYRKGERPKTTLL